MLLVEGEKYVKGKQRFREEVKKKIVSTKPHHLPPPRPGGLGGEFSFLLCSLKLSWFDETALFPLYGSIFNAFEHRENIAM